MVIGDYQPVINDLMSTARELNQVCTEDNTNNNNNNNSIELTAAVSELTDKFTAVKHSVQQQRQSLDQLPCLNSHDVSSSGGCSNGSINSSSNRL